MTESGYGAAFHRHNLAATFDGSKAAEIAAELLSKNLDSSSVELNATRDDRPVQFAELRDELEGVVASPALGTALTKSQAEGAGGGAFMLGGVGLVFGALLGFLLNGAPGTEVSVMRWLATWALVPAFAGGTLGLLAGGLLKQRYEPAPLDSIPPREASPYAGLDSGRETVVHISTNDDSDMRRALDLLEKLHPQRVDKFNTDGEVVATLELGDPASG